MPSAYFTVEKNGNSYTFYGGGYGHGAGMSQTAVKSMIDKGMNYEEILKFFYDNVNIEFIYDNKLPYLIISTDGPYLTFS